MDRERVRGGVTGGLMLIGLGVIWFADWWWPGIMVVLDIAVGSGLAFRGRYIPAMIVMAVFFGIPLLTEAKIPWNVFAPLILISVGVIILTKVFFPKQPSTSSTTTPS